MSLIEQATRRLEELQKAGIRVPGAQPLATPPVPQREPHAGTEAAAPVTHLVEPYIAPPVPGAANYREIDFARLQAKGFITPAVPDSKIMHEFRIIKRPLIDNALGRGAAPVRFGNLIMVTSSLPGEGKSFVSLNLAISMAMEVDCRVLLVDADVVKPTLPKVLDIESGKGLMDVLTQPGLSFGDVILRTNVERLSLALAGSARKEASELLASDAMSRLLQEISRRYPDRIVIFDSPPLLATTESRVLAGRMGQVVMVVEAERTTHGTLEAALSTVENCPVVLTMLNKARDSDAGSYYGYYGYGHGA